MAVAQPAERRIAPHGFCGLRQVRLARAGCPNRYFSPACRLLSLAPALAADSARPQTWPRPYAPAPDRRQSGGAARTRRWTSRPSQAESPSPPKLRRGRSALSTRERVWRAAPRTFAASVTLRPSGSRKFSRRLRPGCGGFIMAIGSIVHSSDGRSRGCRARARQRSSRGRIARQFRGGSGPGDHRSDRLPAEQGQRPCRVRWFRRRRIFREVQPPDS